MIYNAIFVLLTMSVWLSGSQRPRQKLLYWTALIGFFLFSGMRFEVGCDWFSYLSHFERSPYLAWEVKLRLGDPAYWLVVATIHTLDLPYEWVNIALSGIFFIGLSALARRQPNPLAFLVLCFPILIIGMPMSGIRQGAAIGVLCIALVAFIDRRALWFAFWVVLATGFHSSALIFILLLPVATGRYTRNRLILAAMLAVPGALVLASGGSAEVATSRYVNTGVDAAGAVFRVGFIGLSALYFFLFMRKRWQRTFPKDYALVSVGAIAMALAVLLIPISTVIADRFSYYLIPIQSMMLARVPFLPFRMNKNLHAAWPYLSLLSIFTVWLMFSSQFQRCYIPYQNWLFGFPGGSLSRF